jgi:hypothetical protein
MRSGTYLKVARLDHVGLESSGTLLVGLMDDFDQLNGSQ